MERVLEELMFIASYSAIGFKLFRSVLFSPWPRGVTRTASRPPDPAVRRAGTVAAVDPGCHVVLAWRTCDEGWTTDGSRDGAHRA
jgi:hypothetical protein